MSIRPLEGVDLAKTVAEAEKDSYETQHKNVLNEIRHVYWQIAGFQDQIFQSDKQREDRIKQIAKLQAKLDKLKAGDWSGFDD